MTETEFLIDTLDYYIENTERRCFKSGDKNTPDRCYYDPINANKENISEGCAIGRWMTAEQKRDADEENQTVTQLGKEFLPIELKDFNMGFLADVQYLHDNSSNWSVNSLSLLGKPQVFRLIERNKLDISKFKEGTHYVKPTS